MKRNISTWIGFLAIGLILIVMAIYVKATAPKADTLTDCQRTSATACLAVSVYDDAGNPVSRDTVRLIYPNGNTTDTRVTGANGLAVFTLGYLSPSRPSSYTLRVSSPIGFEDVPDQTITLNTNTYVTKTVRLVRRAVEAPTSPLPTPTTTSVPSTSSCKPSQSSVFGTACLTVKVTTKNSKNKTVPAVGAVVQGTVSGVLFGTGLPTDGSGAATIGTTTDSNGEALFELRLVPVTPKTNPVTYQAIQVDLTATVNGQVALVEPQGLIPVAFAADNEATTTVNRAANYHLNLFDLFGGDTVADTCTVPVSRAGSTSLLAKLFKPSTVSAQVAAKGKICLTVKNTVANESVPNGLKIVFNRFLKAEGAAVMDDQIVGVVKDGLIYMDNLPLAAADATGKRDTSYSVTYDGLQDVGNYLCGEGSVDLYKKTNGKYLRLTKPKNYQEIGSINVTCNQKEREAQCDKYPYADKPKNNNVSACIEVKVGGTSNVKLTGVKVTLASLQTTNVWTQIGDGFTDNSGQVKIRANGGDMKVSTFGSGASLIATGKLQAGLSAGTYVGTDNKVYTCAGTIVGLDPAVNNNAFADSFIVKAWTSVSFEQCTLKASPSPSPKIST